MESFYSETIKKELGKKLGDKNVMATPRILKIVLNVGVGEATTNKQAVANATRDLEKIAARKAVVTKARKSVSAFKLREGLAIGTKATLRGKAMMSFLEKMVRIVIPRFRDFKGISSTCVDSAGNFSIGFPEQTLFPEIDYDSIDKLRGLQVTVVTTAGTKERGLELFKTLGVPFHD